MSNTSNPDSVLEKWKNLLESNPDVLQLLRDNPELLLETKSPLTEAEAEVKEASNVNIDLDNLVEVEDKASSVLDSNKSVYIDKYSYDDKGFDHELAYDLQQEFSKNGFSVLRDVFILFCLEKMKTGRKKRDILEMLNLGGLPIRKAAFNTKLNRLKCKLPALVTWEIKQRPQILDITPEGKLYLNEQLANFSYQERLTFNNAVKAVSKKLDDNS